MINDHDIFCRSYYPKQINKQDCIWCNLITTVRENERKKYNVGSKNSVRNMTMICDPLLMIHDPLCSKGYSKYYPWESCRDCGIISQAYRRGYEDAVQDFYEEF